MSYLKDRRTKRQILLDIERKLDTLFKEEEQVIMADIYDTIIAGIAAIQAGDNQALEQHVAALDTHLSNVDGEVLGLQGDDTSTKGRLDAIEAGLGKIANTFTPAPASAAGGSTPPSGGTSTPPASGDGTTSTPPADGSGSADVGPGGPAPAAIPAAGPGSETTGQVDTPVTTG